MNFGKTLAVFLFSTLILAACSNEPSSEIKETVTSGNASILVDDTFLPIIEDQLSIFESTYKRATINLVNAPENRVFHLLLSDSAKIAIVSRQLTEQEELVFTSKNIIPKTRKFAKDAVALITHRNNLDSVISVEEIIQILRGNGNGNRSLVFDNPNSSTVRYLKELAQIDTLPAKGIYALRSNAAVIQHVYENKGAVGVVGVNWLAQPSVELEPLVSEIVALKVKRNESDAEGYKPTQSNLALDLYPLSRDLFLINCQGTYGLGLGFSAFLAGERGQRLILKSGLMPDSLPSRELIIRN